MPSLDKHTDIQSNIECLIGSRKSLLISSLNADNLPEISATPFIKIDTQFYIFISDLASHTQNIKRHPTLSIMLIEDEQDTKNIFARKRLSYECLATMINKEDVNWAPLLEKFEARLGNTVSVLKQLQDFHLFKLTATSGSYIEGFGKAYRLSGNDLNDVELQISD